MESRKSEGKGLSDDMGKPDRAVKTTAGLHNYAVNGPGWEDSEEIQSENSTEISQQKQGNYFWQNRYNKNQESDG